MINQLLSYQEKDSKLHAIEVKISSNDERKKFLTAKKYLDGVEENVNKLDVRSADLVAEYEKMLKESNSLKEQCQEIINATESAEDKTEANYLVKKLEELSSKIKNTSVMLNKLSDEINAISLEYNKIKANTRAAKTMYQESATKYKEFKSTFDSEVQTLKTELAELETKVNPELMERYQEKRKGKIFPIVYEIKDAFCGKCGMELSISEITRLKNGEIVDCANCRCMLYKSKK